MIQGLHIDIKSDELKSLLAERQKYHEKKAALYEKQASQLGEINKEIEDDMRVSKTGVHSPADDAMKSARRHRESAGTYKFVAEHVVPSETYRLGEQDLARLGISFNHY